MLNAEIKVLAPLSAANKRPVKAETLKEQAGLTDAELQMVVSSLVTKGWAKWVTGGELSGKPLSFYEAFITDSGVAALLPHMPFANQAVSEADRWQIEHELIERVHDGAENYKASGDDPLIAVGKAFREMVLDRPAKPSTRLKAG